MFSGTLAHWRCHVFHHIAIDTPKSSQGRSAGSESFTLGMMKMFSTSSVSDLGV